MPPHDTIFALSSGSLPAGVAVVRVSGPQAFDLVRQIAGGLPPPRQAVLRAFRDPIHSEILDHGLVIVMPAPRSFTGEDVAEFHCHGSRAVVAAMLRVLGSNRGVRPAEAGEFTRRAFDNGRLDLTEAEGIADLLAAETEAQRRQALRGATGHFARAAERWRASLLEARAFLEAEIDFVDEDDIPDAVASAVVDIARHLSKEMRTALNGSTAAERVRDGLVVALAGPPNAGKSSLLNALAGRPAAIVTDIPGTTRDVLEIQMDLGGYAVVLVDTAGIRDASDPVEVEGVRRARERALAADLVLWLDEEGRPPPAGVHTSGTVWTLRTKADLAGKVVPAVSSPALDHPRSISVSTGFGIDDLVAAIGRLAGEAAPENALVVNARQRRHVAAAEAALAEVSPGMAPELVADLVRRASEAIGALTGRIDIEDVLGSIFARFCVGK